MQSVAAAAVAVAAAANKSRLTDISKVLLFLISILFLQQIKRETFYVFFEE